MYFSLNIKGRLLEFHRPAVMGILNITPDSFFKESRTTDDGEIENRAAQMIAEGADIIDLGGYSSRPGAEDVPACEELERVRRGIRAVRRISSDIPVSVDTFRAAVAEAAIAEGADIVNDISGGTLDEEMFTTVARLRVPYILMHMRGTPATMQTLTQYNNVAADIIGELSEKLHKLQLMGVADIIIDPGFGFAKTTAQNYELLRKLPLLAELLEKPILVGVSRKSMATVPCCCTPAEALPATTALNTLALLQGASILRVHDVAAARQAIAVTTSFLSPEQTPPTP